jgi:hypothetical protein
MQQIVRILEALLGTIPVALLAHLSRAIGCWRHPPRTSALSHTLMQLRCQLLAGAATALALILDQIKLPIIARSRWPDARQLSSRSMT